MRITDTHPLLLPRAQPAAGGMAGRAPQPAPARRWQRTLAIAGVVVAAHAAAFWTMAHTLRAQPAELPREPDVIQATLLAPPQPEPATLVAAPQPPEPTPQPPKPEPVKPKTPPPPKPQPKVVQPKPRPTPKPTPRPVAQPAAPVPEPPAAAPAPAPAAEAAPRPAASTAAPAAPAAATTLPSSSAAYLNNAPPPYPAMSRRLGETGKVVVRVLIGADGRAEKAEIAQSSGYQRLDDAALQTARDRWRYVPGTKAGVPTAMWFKVPINFVLE